MLRLSEYLLIILLTDESTVNEWLVVPGLNPGWTENLSMWNMHVLHVILSQNMHV